MAKRILHLAPFFSACGLALLLASNSPALAQDQPSSQQPPKHAKKVWTNEDVVQLRTPSDEYVRQKELREEEARRARKAEEAAKKAAKKAAAAKSLEAAPETPAEGESPKPRIPTTVPELEKRLTELTEKIDGLERQIAGVDEELVNGREDERVTAGQRKQALEKELEKTREESYLVRDRLQTLRPQPRPGA